MINDINCPYYATRSGDCINCMRGYQTATFESIEIESQIKRYCQNRYTKCINYKYLERGWGHAEAKQVAVCA